jgi:hypothetical protein
VLSLWMMSSEFLLWEGEYPTNALSNPLRYFASEYVGEGTELTMGLRGTLSLWIFGSPYSLGGIAACGISFFLVSSGRSDPLMREALCFSILEVGSHSSLFYT